MERTDKTSASLAVYMKWLLNGIIKAIYKSTDTLNSMEARYHYDIVFLSTVFTFKLLSSGKSIRMKSPR